MIAVTVDGEVRDLLESLTQDAQLRGPEGQLIGYFKPFEVASAQIKEKAKEFFDREEAVRRLASEGRAGFSLQEVMRHLKALQDAEIALGLVPPGGLDPNLERLG